MDCGIYLSKFYYFPCFSIITLSTCATFYDQLYKKIFFRAPLKTLSNRPLRHISAAFNHYLKAV